jgi:hypothetical protein
MSERVRMIATREMTYATRRLKAEDPFEARRGDARLLAALGRARLVEEGVPAAPAPKPAAAAKRPRAKKARKARS